MEKFEEILSKIPQENGLSEDECVFSFNYICRTSFIKMSKYVLVRITNFIKKPHQKESRVN